MSLVNDLLIEVDRRREHERGRVGTSVDGLAPSTPLQQRRRRPLVPMLLATVAGAVLALATILSVDRIGVSSAGPGSGAAAIATPPAVSARQPDLPPLADILSTEASSETADVARNDEQGDEAARPRESAPVEHLSIRPVSIRGIELERNPRATRLRIRTDELAMFRIEETSNERAIEVIVESAVLEAPIRPVDLLGTPIRRMQTRTSDAGLVLTLTLDSAPRIQSQWIEDGRGATLVIDLQNDMDAQAESPVRESIAASSDRNRPTRAPAGRDGRDGQALQADPILAAAIDGPPDDLGAPARGVHIARSASDRLRVGREAAQSRAVLELEAARFARAEGDFHEASKRYARALEIVPGFRDAILEWVALRAARGETPEAIALLREARRASPKDTGLLMLHARLLADGGDHSAAIGVLDTAGLGLGKAPEIHALAAAYTQQLGDHEDAISRYETILKRHPGQPSWWMGLGISLEAAGRRAEAIDVYGIAMQVGPLPGNTRRWVSARVDALRAEED